MPADTLRPLLELVRRLRAPDGCPWDREQRLPDVRAYLLEEAHEVATAIDHGDPELISEELGDLLFQVVFTAELNREEGGDAVEAIARRIHDKMVERHPHVFGETQLDSPDEVNRAWESRKAREKAPGVSILDGVPPSLPALLSAYRTTQKAAGVGFDWPDVESVLAKVDEELAELRAAIAEASRTGDSAAEEAKRAAIVEELGDLLFAVANLGRHLGADPEGALAGANLKFRRRFGEIERSLAAEDRPLTDATLEEMDRHWERAKTLEKRPAADSDA